MSAFTLGLKHSARITDHQHSTAFVRSSYARVVAGTPLWRHGTAVDLAAGPIHR